MALLPARNILDGTALPVTSTMKTSMGSLRDYLAGLLGTDSTDKLAALTALGITTELGAFSHRNKIINNNFAVNQRAVSGTVVLAAGVYGHDRWKAGAGGCTYTFATSANVTTLTISAGTLMQVIEGANLLSGTHVLTWTGTATARVATGSYGATGLTGTATGGTNQTIEFATGTVSKVQYEPGSVATPFEHRPIGIELALCQRYYYRVFPGSVATHLAFGATYNATVGRYLITFPVTMRIAPTALEQSGTANHYAIFQAGIGATVCSSVPSFSTASTGLATVVGQVASGLTVFNPGTLHTDATNGAAAYLGFSAEL